MKFVEFTQEPERLRKICDTFNYISSVRASRSSRVKPILSCSRLWTRWTPPALGRRTVERSIPKSLSRRARRFNVRSPAKPAPQTR